jgi:Mn-dependent DtxR family transcriptional regulator
LVLKSRIAVRVRRDLKTVAAALEELGRLHLARRSGRYRWGTTRRGRDCKVNEIPDPARRRGGKAYGRLVPGAGAARLLAVLDRPMSGADLARRLGVSHQRVHQLVFKLYALGLVRLGDEDRPLHVVARTDDPSVLLLGDEVRVLSVVPDDFTTTLSKIRMAARFPAKRTEAALANLRVEGLVEVIAGPRGNRLYRLTTAGATHFQRDLSADPAEPPPLKVKSDRVLGVLSHMAQAGEVRIRSLADALQIPHPSANALMQYLKRRGLVHKTGGGLKAPYALTDEGRGILEELLRRAER